MADLTNVIETLRLRIECPHCGYSEEKSLHWLSGRRDMNCCQCSGVIVLNTSNRKREMAALRRQVENLHDQLIDAIATPDCIKTPAGKLVRAPLSTPRPELCLVHAYKDCSGRALADPLRATGRSRR